MKIQRLLKRLGACKESRKWAKGRRCPRKAWRECPDEDWLIWIARKAGIGQPRIRAAIVDTWGYSTKEGAQIIRCHISIEDILAGLAKKGLL